MRSLEHINSVQSLTQMRNPIKTPFGISTIPIIHIGDPTKYDSDRANILSDPRFRLSLINRDATALVIAAKTKDGINLDESDQLIGQLDTLTASYGFEEIHFLGRSYFQDELVEMKIEEMLFFGFISVVLLTIILILVYRKIAGVMIALGSIGLGLLIFLGLLAAMGRELSVMASLYPVLMLIVGTSDVIHIMTKYTDLLQEGKDKITAMTITVKEIGMATLLTSLTTAIGFATLLTSNVGPIREFGVNAALGVMVAYVTVIFFTTSVLLFFSREQIIKETTTNDKWVYWMSKCYTYTRYNSKKILVRSVVFITLCIVGMGMVTTNNNIDDTLPRNSKLSKDFKYFESEFAGFRPLEFAINVVEPHQVDDYKVVQQISAIEDHLLTTGKINSIMSQATLYKSLHKMDNANRSDAYRFPDDENKYNQYQKMIVKTKMLDKSALISKDGTKTRISSRISDMGADSIRVLMDDIDGWIVDNIDQSIISVRSTGTGLMVDKNGVYIRNSLLKGLLLALVIVSILMGFLFNSMRMLLIALVPNLIPLLFAAGLIGWLGIELDAGVSIIFAIVFGIAVDDTIHFLSRYKLARVQGMNIEEALLTCYTETGKAIVITTIILFFGFLVLIFSDSLPTNTVGLLISVTLLTAVIFDLYLLPILIRYGMESDR